MFANNARVLLVLSQDVLDRARVFAGKATATLKLPVSLQIVLRALIGEGLKRSTDQALRANIAGQAKAVRHIRSATRHQGRTSGRPDIAQGRVLRVRLSHRVKAEES